MSRDSTLDCVPRSCLLALALAALALATLACTATPDDADFADDFADDFDGGRRATQGIVAEWIGGGKRDAVRGFEAVGFRGRFLRNTADAADARSTLTLTGLPPHTAISLGFLLALIDSWDGTCGDARIAAGGAIASTHCPDYFAVTIDGDTVFSETFFFEDSLPQTYDETRGTLLSRGRNLGPERSWQTPGTGLLDLAYDMAREPAFQRIPHSATSVTITFLANGAGWQGGDDESWAIDNVVVRLHRQSPEQ